MRRPALGHVERQRAIRREHRFDLRDVRLEYADGVVARDLDPGPVEAGFRRVVLGEG